jgi:hypothetical protein
MTAIAVHTAASPRSPTCGSRPTSATGAFSTPSQSSSAGAKNSVPPLSDSHQLSQIE